MHLSELLIGGRKPARRELAHLDTEGLVGAIDAEQVTDVGEREAGTLCRADVPETPDVFGAIAALAGHSVGLGKDADRLVVPDR